MADMSSMPREADAATCWQCGAPARADCAYQLRLYASSGDRLDSRGLPVKRGRDQDIVTVAVPRCLACRSRNRISVTIVLAGTAVGCLLAPLLQSEFWPQFDRPQAGLFQYGIGSTAVGVGLLVGFVVSLLAAAVYKRRAGMRPLDTYPPVRMLRRDGWHYPVARSS
jgi:hypothetical protein